MKTIEKNKTIHPANQHTDGYGISDAELKDKQQQMIKSTKDQKLEADLLSMLGDFPGLSIDVSRSPRWKRMCVTFIWDGFDGLLPEERFHRLVNVIPADFCNTRLAGFVWLELTSNETVETFLKLPRSEDIGNHELEIDASLRRVGFFELLRDSMGSQLRRSCPGDFSLSAKIMSTVNFTTRQVTDAKLLFIHYGAYCDCQVLQSVNPTVAKRHAIAG